MEAQRKALQRGEAPRMEGVQHSSLTTDVLEDCVGPRWDEKRHVRLDFSSPLFCLETLTGRDGGLLNPRLNLSNLLTLDISNNALTDIDSVLSVHNGFKRLHTLKASRNRITQADLDLPTLAYLDLSFNQLKRLPRFEGIRNTEELLLSNNHISDSDLESFVLLGNLRVLDLSYNRISTLPSNFVEDLAYLKGLTKLTKVDFRGNQCSAWFPEYAAVLVGNAVARGQHLQQLDGEAIAPRSEKEITEMAAQVIANLEQYDSIYIERQEAEATRPRLAKYAIKTALAGDDGDVTIGRLSEILERVHAMEEEERISTFWRQLPASDKARRNAAKELVQKAQLALEVCEEARPLILRGLASLCLVSEGSLGHKLAAVLSRMAQQEFAAQSEGDVGGIAAQVLAEIVVPSILEAADQERVVMDVLTGLTEGTECLSLAVALSSCVSLLADLLTVSGPTPHLCRVLCVICLSQENCVEATGQGIPQLLCRRVLDEGVPEDDQGLMLFCDMCIIMGRCAWHNRKASLHLTRAAIHTSIFLPKLRDLIGEREATSRLPIPQAKVAGAIIGALTGMIRSCDEAMDICCDNYHLIDLLLPALKEEAADPVILAASCTGVRVILENPRQRAELLQYVTEEMRGFEGLLQYLGGTRYTAMCDRAELALRNINQLPYVPERVPLNRLTNIYACRVLASICNFLAFYLAEETDQMVQGIAEELFAAHREKAIVDVLEVKNEEVLVAAVECLNSIPLRYITKETVALLLKLSVVKLLTRLALWESPQVHAVLWGMHAAETVNAVFDVIYRNLSTLRTPARKAVIENMHALNRVSVHFLLAASRVSSVRDTMRLKGVVSLFGPVLEAEQQVDVHPDGFDVVVERTWTGRDVNVLLTSLSGTHKLNPKKKEAFRIVCRLADIIQGWPDTPDAAKDLSLRALCSREGEMWDDDAALRRHLEMDDREESERAPQQTDFVRLCIAERLSLLLTPLCSHSTTQRYARQRAMKQHAEYWAGRLKADIEDAEEEIAKASKLAEEEAAAEEEEETAVLQQPQQRSDLLRAIAQSKPRSWRERVQNRSRPHHQQTTNAQAKKKKKQKDSLEELQDDPVYADLYGKPEEGKTGA
ncbi:leucine rich repeat containing protein, putative [Eimeria acervulina]|uniref:Leucine rich repeat containing protein, putative n=1 Tax=Eimeria acervulina TaxID=5801 RepID=U6GWL3_EIMAC|nr:leucine rich repeat containing protein, putative [Eimeria acervulina]CDI83997.1 leucine rich repeat containing protein, putative [Eimeria acervulina]